MDQQHHITIDKLNPERWEDFKALRLEALSSDPDAYCATYEETLAYPDEYWLERLIEPEHITLFLKDGKRLIGTLSAHTETNDETGDRHIAVLNGFYVHKAFRGLGLGKKLLHAILGILKDEGIHKVELSVRENLERSRNLYEKLGFKEVGRKDDALETEDGYIAEILMEKLL